MGAVFGGCTKPGEAELVNLRLAQHQVQQGLDMLQLWHEDSVANARTRVSERFLDLDWLTADTSLDYSLEDAQIIGDWTRVRRFLKDGPERLVGLEKEGQYCLSQLQNLVEAIEAGATKDANGTAMDETYFAREAGKESAAASAWLAAAQETERLLTLGTQLEASARSSIDSLIVAKRAEWAQNIASGE